VYFLSSNPYGEYDVCRRRTDGTGEVEPLFPAFCLKLNSGGDYLYALIDGIYLNVDGFNNPFDTTGSMYIAKIKVSDLKQMTSIEDLTALFDKAERYDVGNESKPGGTYSQFTIAYDWIFYAPSGNTEYRMIKTDFSGSRDFNEWIGTGNGSDNAGR
jgi:hypothetical protein